MSASVPSSPERIEVPGAVVDVVDRPGDVASLAALLAERHAKSEGVLVVGGRTRLAQANRAGRLAAALSLEGLAGIDVFEPDEGVVHARAGTPVRALREAVAAEGWELPLDPPGAATTVGGTIASASVGPRAQVFGRVADAVLGLELVGADGTPTKCGGRVVKNVTGYDMAKLYTGSFGSLAVVTGAWLRLRPQPAKRVVLAGRLARDPATFEAARLAARATTVRAFVWNEAADEADTAELVVELGGGEAAVAQDRDALLRTFALAPADPLAVDRVRDARAHAATTAPLGLRARVVATRLEPLRRTVLDAGCAVSIDLGIGVVTARGGAAGADGAARSDARTLLGLREQALASGGALRFDWLPAALAGEVDVFGEEAGTRALVVSLKQRFDPHRILNPGRFVAGT
ncbi:MAG: FAD-binding oxidoreductase [Myxococcota bacterium]